MITIDIGGTKIGEGYPVFVVAEAGVNHNGDLDLAKKHIREAKLSGANAIKFQTYKAEGLVTKSAPIYWHVGANEGESQYEVFSKMDDFSLQFYKECIKYAKEVGILFLSTPFDLSAVDLLEEIGVPAYKVASADITYHQLLKKIALTNKPIILSTGASTIGEIEEAVKIIKDAGNNQIILLHCILSYPTPQKDINLSMIPILNKLFPDFPIGLSDHTFDPMTPAFATMLGAKVIEKHFTVDKNLDEKNPDNKLGVDPYELKILVEEVRQAEKSFGEGISRPTTETDALNLARRSVVSTVEIKKGTKITEQMLICKRPGTGIQPKFMEVVTGLKAVRNIPQDSVITWDMVKGLKIDVIIAARMGSSRLPGKTLKKLRGKPLLEHVIERAKKISGVSDVIVATSSNPNNKPIINLCRKMKIPYFVGSEEDVLDRHVKAALKHKSDIVVGLTADNPFIEPAIAEKLIQAHINNKNDYSLSFGHPLGTSCEVFTTDKLDYVNKITDNPTAHEHMGVYFLNHHNEFKVEAIKAIDKWNHPEIRLTIDVAKDFKTAENLLNELGDNFDLDDIIELFKNKKRIFVNKDIQQIKPTKAFEKIFAGKRPL